MHVIANKKKLLARIRRIRGQIESIEAALCNEVECGEVLQRVASARGALNGLMSELIEDHVRSHVSGSEGTAATRRRAAEELFDIVRTYLK